MRSIRLNILEVLQAGAAALHGWPDLASNSILQIYLGVISSLNGLSLLPHTHDKNRWGRRHFPFTNQVYEKRRLPL